MRGTSGTGAGMHACASACQVSRGGAAPAWLAEMHATVHALDDRLRADGQKWESAPRSDGTAAG